MPSPPRFALVAAVLGASLLAADPVGAVRGPEPGKRDFDSRDSRPPRAAAPSDPGAVGRLDAQLGPQGVVDLDDRTGTPRMVARLDGFLTDPSGDDPAAIVFEYVRSQRAVFGLGDDDLAALRLTRRDTDVHGITHLTWAQTWRGIPAWDTGLRASVNAEGRLINVGGSPVPGLASRSPEPELAPTRALGAALGDVGRRGLVPRATPRGGAARRTSFTGGHSAELRLFVERRGDVHLAWKVTDRAAPQEIYEHLIDARTGDVLYRHNQVAALDAEMSVFTYTPAHPPQTTVSGIPVTGSGDLDGPNARVFVAADDTPGPDFEIPADNHPTSGTPKWADAFVPVTTGCPAAPCSWDDDTPFSWQVNQRQTATNLFYFINEFHDWLDAEVGFSEYEDADRMIGVALVGADKNGTGLPQGNTSNAFFDGSSISFLLWHTGRSPTDDPSIVFHEYGHGVSFRLVRNEDGSSGLTTYQTNSMGEAWGDWYAMDYLVANGLEADDPGDGDVAPGVYVHGTPTGVRGQGLDCPVGSTDDECGSIDTYGDMTGVDIHLDGEIWSATLWELREALGGSVTRDLVTEAMRLSPGGPTFLDMRNAILQADQVLNDGENEAAIWDIFARRGMGVLASTDGGADKSPDENFNPPPAPGTGVDVRGRLTDATTGQPIPNALIRFGQFPSAATNEAGDFTLPEMPPATYPEVIIAAPGYELVVRRNVTLGPGDARFDEKLRRNFAAAAAGATVVDSPEPPLNDSCLAERMLDGDLGQVWGERIGEKSMTVRLPETVDVGSVRIDPGAGCGDDDTASTGAYRLETSTDGTSFTQASTGTFTPADNHRLNAIPVDRDDVRFVRFTMRAPQSRAPGTSGEDFLDAAELEVFAKPPPKPPGQRPAPDPPATVPGPGPGPSPDLTAPVGRFSLVGGQRIRTALRRGLRIRIACDEPCSGRFSATIDARTAKKAGLLGRRSRRRSVKVAAGTTRLGEGRRTARLRFSSRARKRLRRQKRVKLSIAARVADEAGNRRSQRFRGTLRR